MPERNRKGGEKGSRNACSNKLIWVLERAGQEEPRDLRLDPCPAVRQELRRIPPLGFSVAALGSSTDKGNSPFR